MARRHRSRRGWSRCGRGQASLWCPHGFRRTISRSAVGRNAADQSGTLAPAVEWLWIRLSKIQSRTHHWRPAPRTGKPPDRSRFSRQGIAAMETADAGARPAGDAVDTAIMSLKAAGLVRTVVHAMRPDRWLKRTWWGTEPNVRNEKRRTGTSGTRIKTRNTVERRSTGRAAHHARRRTLGRGAERAVSTRASRQRAGNREKSDAIRLLAGHVPTAHARRRLRGPQQPCRSSLPSSAPSDRPRISPPPSVSFWAL